MNRLKFFLFFLFVIAISTSFSQTYEEIVSSSDYLFGEGKGVTLKQADDQALSMLISQISVNIQSTSDLSRRENDSGYSEDFNSVIKTFSTATISNTQRLVLSQEPDAKVIRYIKKEDITKIFEGRKNKILSFIEAANQAEKNQKIADALKYYYWALILIKSHPYPYEIKLQNNELAATLVPINLDRILDNIHFNCEQISKDDNYKEIVLNISYKNMPVSNLDYNYFDGRDWSNIISAKDGKGIIEFYGAASQLEKCNLKVEYIFENEAKIDNEIENVMAQITPIPFKKAYQEIELEKAKKEEIKEVPIAQDIKLKQIDSKPYEKIINKIAKSISDKNYIAVLEFFTENGFKMFTQLINYGNAKVLPYNGLTAIAFQNNVICRSVPMVFSFKNNKQFIENIVFHFDTTMKIDAISFSLDYKAYNDIASKTLWSDVERFIIINFLEHYKTAYALKRLDYIESIFDDNALIITGYVVKLAPSKDNVYLNNKIVKFNRQSKEQYIKKLSYSFNSKEYINLKFEDSEISKAGAGNHIYGIQIKQNYYSSNYGDQGYLFLMVDLKTPNEPIIHVRTWQPEKNPDGSIFGLGDF